MPLPLDHLLEHAARHWPDHLAVGSEGTRWTWSELNQSAHARADRLRDTPGRLAIAAHPTAETVAWIWGALLARAPFTLVGPRWPQALRDSIRDDFQPTVWVDTRWESLPLKGGDAGEAEVASVLYTSGSRGDPKGVAMTAAAMAASVHTIGEYLGLHDRDRVWGGLPLHYGYGLYQTFLCARAGAALILPTHPELVGHCLEVLERDEVSVLPGVPALWSQLLGAQSFHEKKLPELRTLTNAGDHFPTTAIRELRRRFPRLRMHAMYGLTEYTRVATLDPDEIDANPGSVGRPLPGCQVRVVDEAGRAVIAGETGELVVRGDHLMLGYWRDPESTRKALRPLAEGDERWLWTGDLFRQDERGHLYHEGRRDDVFKCRGQKVAPRRVAHALESFPGVIEAAVVPQTRNGGDVAVQAYLKVSGNLDTAGLRAHCGARLASHEVPSSFEVVSEFPRNERGKLDRFALAHATRPTGRKPCP